MRKDEYAYIMIIYFPLCLDLIYALKSMLLDADFWILCCGFKHSARLQTDVNGSIEKNAAVFRSVIKKNTYMRFCFFFTAVSIKPNSHSQSISSLGVGAGSEIRTPMFDSQPFIFSK